MDTKLKTVKWPKLGLSITICVIFSILVMTFAFFVSTSHTPYYQHAGYGYTLHKNSYTLYWKLTQKNNDTPTLTPTDIFFPAASELVQDIYTAQSSIGVTQEQALIPEYISEFDAYSYDLMNSWYHSLTSQDINYIMYDQKTGNTVGNFGDDILNLAKNGGSIASSDEKSSLSQKYLYYIVLQWDSDGHMSIASSNGIDETVSAHMRDDGIENELFYSGIDSTVSQLLSGTMIPPSNVTAVYAMPKLNTPMQSDLYQTVYYDAMYSFVNEPGFAFTCFALLILSFVLGLIIAFHQKFPIEGSFLSKLSPESTLGILLLSAFFIVPVMQFLLPNFLYQNLFASIGMPVFGGMSWLAVIVYGLGSFVILSALFSISHVMGISVYQIHTLGVKKYLSKKSYIIMFLAFLGRQLKRLWRYLCTIDLREASDRGLIKIMVANFLVMAALSFLWIFCLPLLVAYTIIVFILLRKEYRNLKSNYSKLLQTAQDISQGKLDTVISEDDLGIFEPIKQELCKVQDGFSHAVDEHLKSQSMKTELITNVSHDLKTPLTAIITYIDLLKQEDITEEDRQSYIDTLDVKSQRLKRLIEDLFEVSKASSKNIVLTNSTVELQSLLKQVEAEASELLSLVEITFKYHFPSEKTLMVLDGEKTSRIFENLILNVAKYSLPGTRAHVTIIHVDDGAHITISNISKYELDFDEEQITDRFVRGDISRNTDGSGLGLAIAKSFTEAQGGHFSVQIDGDMFKAMVWLPSNLPPDDTDITTEPDTMPLHPPIEGDVQIIDTPIPDDSTPS